MDFTLKLKIRHSGVIAVLYDDDGKFIKDYFGDSISAVVADVNVSAGVNYAITRPGNRLIISFVGEDETLDFGT